MTLKVNLDALKAKLEGKKETKESKSSVFLKPTEAGVVKFRAMMYPHQADPESNPFADRYYHYNIAGEMTFYCPKQNLGQKCHICDYVWEITKQDGMKKDEKMVWYKKLPNGSVYIPGLVRGKESEGPKFLKIGTRKDKMSANHEKIFKWFFDEDTQNWLDPEKGFDMEIEYEAYDAAKSKALGNAKFGLKDIVLARRPSKFGNSPSYEEFAKQIKDIDTVFLPKTTEDSLNLLKKLNSEKATDEDLNKSGGSVITAPRSVPESTEDIESALENAGL